MDMTSLIRTVGAIPDCTVHPPCGIPTIDEEHILPSDLREFYQLCGGVNLFESADFPVCIVPPQRLVLANPVIFVGASEEELEATKNDISWSWYIIGEGHSAQYITIDLSPQRLGRCYDSFWDRHPGNSSIIAKSFTDLLLGLLSYRGEYYYWKDPEFTFLGNPHD
jgi:hypothetical protein